MANCQTMRFGGGWRGLWTVKVIGGLIETIAGGAGLKNVREVGERLTKSDTGSAGGRAGELVEKLLDVVGSDLLDYGQSVVTGMKNTTGQGDPETGDAFGEAQSTFNGVNGTLKSAVPDDGWDGSGSDAYADQNTRQQLRSEAMADADHEVHKVLYREAAQITLRRGYLDDQYNFLANTSYVTFPLQFIPRYGEAMKLAIEIGALQTALGESYHQMNRLQSEVAQNAAELQQAVGRYSGVADGAELPGAAAHFDPPPPPRAGACGTTSTGSQRGAAGGIAGPSGVSGGIDPPPGRVPGPMLTEDEAATPEPRSTVAGPPPLLQVPPLGPLLSPAAGFVTGAAPGGRTARGRVSPTPRQEGPSPRRGIDRPRGQGRRQGSDEGRVRRRRVRARARARRAQSQFRTAAHARRG